MTANNPNTRRQKGKSFEREIAQDLREAGLDKNARRMPCSGALEDLKADIITDLPIHLECKRQEKWNVEKFYQQALEGKKQHQVAIVVMRKNNKTTMAMLAWKDLIWFLQLAKETGQLQAEYGYQKRKQLNK
jgi:Holliday junction resolvase